MVVLDDPIYISRVEMLLNNGELNGVRILSEASVKLMSRNHLNLDDPEAASFGASGIGFGLTVGVLEDAGQAGMFGPDGQYFWGGAASTTFWVDPEKKITAVFTKNVELKKVSTYLALGDSYTIGYYYVIF